MNSSADSHQAIKVKCSSTKSPFYIGNKIKRMLSKSYSKTINHADATAYVAKLIESRWNSGLSISKVEVTANLYVYCTRNKISDWLETYGGECNKKKDISL